MRRLKNKIQAAFLRLSEPLRSNSGMEMVQIAILVAIALGLIFKSAQK